MRRSRLVIALLLSLALHLGLGLLLFLARTPEPPRPPESRRKPLQIVVVERTQPPLVEPPLPKPPAPEVTPPRPPRGTARAPRPEAPPAPPAEATAAPPAASPEAPTSEAPPADTVPDSPRAVVLLPGPGGMPVGPQVPGLTPGGSGRTLRPGDGPSAEQLRAEEGARVQGRVQGFLDDGLATLRVENGLVDSFFGDMDQALEKGLSGAPLFGYQGVIQHFFKASPERGQALREQLAALQRYGATGSPGAPGESSGSERLEDSARSGAAGARARSQPSAVNTLDAYSKAAGTLHVTLELEQSRTGQLLSAKLVKGSGNPLFDAYVLERVPTSLAALGPAPEHFSVRMKGVTVRSVWAVEGHVSFARTLKLSELNKLNAEDAAYISALAPLGLLSGNFEETRGEVIIPDLRRPHFDIHTRLLRVY